MKYSDNGFYSYGKKYKKILEARRNDLALPIIPKTETNHHKFSLSSKMSDELEI